MKHQWKTLLCMLLALLMLTGCSGDSGNSAAFPEATQNLGTPTDAPVQNSASGTSSAGISLGDQSSDLGGSIFSQNPYDIDDSSMADSALSEENISDPNDDGDSYLAYVDPNATVYPYAGSTPIPIDPVDMPTPTPRPSLSFTYTTYTASMGLTFEAPVGWTADETQADAYVLSEPISQMKDGQQAVVTIVRIAVGSNYSTSEITAEVRARLDTLETAYSDWNPSLTATRYMMGREGVYANYTATTSSGVTVGGRIHYVCVDNVLYGLEMVFPSGFREDFIDVFGQIRSSLKRAQ